MGLSTHRKGQGLRSLLRWSGDRDGAIPETKRMNGMRRFSNRVCCIVAILLFGISSHEEAMARGTGKRYYSRPCSVPQPAVLEYCIAAVFAVVILASFLACVVMLRRHTAP